MTQKTKKITHIGFEIILILKTIFAFFETLSGVALIFVTTERIKIISSFVEYELQKDPDELIMNILQTFIKNFTPDMHLFTIIYLISHGLVKLAVLFLLWRKKIWAYPLYMVLLSAFIVYQIFSFKTNPILMSTLTIFDIAMIWFTYLEYNERKSLGVSN